MEDDRFRFGHGPGNAPAAVVRVQLAPAGYVFPPDLSHEDPAESSKRLAICVSRPVPPVAVRYAGDTAWTWISGDRDNLRLKWYVAKDETPFVNGGGDWTALFKTGDACDLQIALPRLGKCRYLISMFEKKPVVVRLRYDAKNAPPNQGVWYRSPVSQVYVPVVERLPLEPKVQRGENWYTVEVSIPWKTLGIDPRPGSRISAEVGVLCSDPTGNTTVSRDYFSSGQSGMVKDVPTEVLPTENWGTWALE